MLTRWTAIEGYDPDVLEAISRVIHGPSAIVSKVTRLGFTTSAAAIASAENFKVLIVGPTRKIGTDTVKKADDGALIVYGHSHCRKLQETFKQDQFMTQLPLPLPSPCPCYEYPECDLTNAWFESAPVRTMTYAKLKSLMLVNSEEANYIKDQLSDLDVVVFDESHKISLPVPPMVDLNYTPGNIPLGYEELSYVFYGFLTLASTIHEDRICKSIEEDLEYAGTDCKLTRPVSNCQRISPQSLRAAFSELIKLALQREMLNYREQDILFLKNLCSVMVDRELCVSFIRGSEGSRWLLMGKHTVEQNAIKSFLEEVCPKAKVFFVSGTQFESREGLFNEIVGPGLEATCMPDVKNNNRSMTIYADYWKADTINLGKKLMMSAIQFERFQNSRTEHQYIYRQSIPK